MSAATLSISQNSSVINSASSLQSVVVSKVGSFVETSAQYYPISLSESPYICNKISRAFDDIIENENTTVAFEAACSNSSSKTVSYVLRYANGTAAPSWISFDSANQSLILTEPPLSSNLSQFQLISTLSSPSKTIAANIAITVNPIVVETETVEEEPDEIETAAVEQATVSSQTTTLIGTLINTISSMSGNISSAAIWQMVNQLQLLMFLLLTGAYLPEEIKDYFKGMQFMSFNFNFIPYEKLPGVSLPANFLNFEQPSTALSEYGLQSGSSFNNNLAFMFLMFTLVISHLVFLLVRAMSEEEGGCLIKLYNKILKKLYSLFTYSIYIRCILEGFVLILISCLAEMYLNQTNNRNMESQSQMPTFKIISLIFSIFMFLLLVGFFTFCIMHLRTDIEDKEEGGFRELYSGIKDNRWAMINSVAFILRRSAFAFLLIFSQGINIYLKISLLCLLELIYLGLFITIRPFKKTSMNLIEIVNELFFCFFASSQLNFHQKDHWSKSTILIYLNILTANSICVVIITIGSSILPLLKHCSSKCKKSPKPPLLASPTVEINMNSYTRKFPSQISTTKIPPKPKRHSSSAYHYPSIITTKEINLVEH